MASSIKRTGSPSRTGYTRRQAVHFRDSGSLFSSRSFLQAGQTSRSKRSWGIMMQRLYDCQNLFHHRVTKTLRKTRRNNHRTGPPGSRILPSDFSSVFLCASVSLW